MFKRGQLHSVSTIDERDSFVTLVKFFLISILDNQSSTTILTEQSLLVSISCSKDPSVALSTAKLSEYTNLLVLEWRQYRGYELFQRLHYRQTQNLEVQQKADALSKKLKVATKVHSKLYKFERA